MTTTETHCEHAAQARRADAPVIAEMAAALAHLQNALAADSHTSAAHYTAPGRQLLPEWIRGNADRIRLLLDELLTQYPDNDALLDEPARANPALAVTCPTCSAQPGDLCTSHSGTRTRRYDIHRARGAAFTAAGCR
jgi:hypothetical protein